MSIINKYVAIKFDGVLMQDKQVAMQIGDKDVMICPNFGTIDLIEQKFGLMDFSAKLAAGDIRVSQVAWVLHCALLSGGHASDYTKMGEWCRSNLATAGGYVAEIIGALFNASAEDTPKKAQATRKIAK